MSEYYDPSSPVAAREWPQPWGEDPSRAWRGSSPDLYYHAAGVKSRKAKDPKDLVQVWEQASSWVRSQDDPSPALVVLESAAYAASQGKQVAFDALMEGFERKLFPSSPVDAWKERWRRDSFALFLCESVPGSAQARLADMVLEQWPWLFGWAGQEGMPYKHPICASLRKGNRPFAEKLMDAIPSQDWLDWSDYYETRGLWRERHHWFEQDPSWVLRWVSYDDRLMAINPAKGLGILETAVKDFLPDLTEKLLDHGFKPDPLQSFGLTLAHWAVHGMSEQVWNQKKGAYDPKEPARIEEDAIRCGKTLGMLANRGFGLDQPVVKAPKIPDVRRPRGLPKAPETASAYLERKRSDGALKEETYSLIQRAMLETQIQSVSLPSVSTPSSRKRL